MEKLIIEQMTEKRWFYTFTEANKKGEKLIIELEKCEVCGLENLFWSIHTYVKDAGGNCFGIYNPQHKGQIINFDWILEATEENKEKLINETYRLFSTAKRETESEGII